MKAQGSERSTIGSPANTASTATYPVPGRRNLALLVAASLACVCLLWAASRAESLWMLGAAALAFSFTANTMFALLHEAVHGVLHDNAFVNRQAGRWAAAFFPTSFELQRSYHLVHHRNNRTPAERFDYIQPGEVRWLKYAQWYAILTGLYWAISVIGVLSYFFVPRFVRRRFLPARETTVARQTGSATYLAALDQLPPLRTRLEILFACAVQVALFYLLDLDWVAWAACYAAFGLHWSSLQYADHAFSPLDERDGAWNLKANPISRAFFLNYHYHLAHHRRPELPWLYLKEFVRPDEPQPSFLRVWLAMWSGPRPLPRPDEPRTPAFAEAAG